MTRKKKARYKKMEKADQDFMYLAVESYRVLYGHDIGEAKALGDTEEDVRKVIDLTNIVLDMAEETGSYEEAKLLLRSGILDPSECSIEDAAGIKSVILKMLQIHFGLPPNLNFGEELKTVLTPEEFVVAEDMNNSEELSQQNSKIPDLPET